MRRGGNSSTDLLASLGAARVPSAPHDVLIDVCSICAETVQAESPGRCGDLALALNIPYFPPNYLRVERCRMSTTANLREKRPCASG